jgi:hypothetical protein
MAHITSEGDLSQWHRQWANYHVLLAMTKLGFFEVMADGQARSADQLAEQLQADARALDICGRILVHAGLLSYAGGKIQNRATSAQCPGATQSHS